MKTKTLILVGALVAVIVAVVYFVRRSKTTPTTNGLSSANGLADYWGNTVANIKNVSTNPALFQF